MMRGGTKGVDVYMSNTVVMVPSPQDSPFDYIAYIRYFQAAAYPSVANDPRTISSLLVPSSKNTDQDDAHAIQADEDDISVQRRETLRIDHGPQLQLSRRRSQRGILRRELRHMPRLAGTS